MINGLKHLHLFFAWLVIPILAIAVILFAIGFFNKKTLSPLQEKLRLFAVIITGLQLLLGVIMYVAGPYWKLLKSGVDMSDSLNRLQLIEHPLTMILAIILVHIGSARIKRAKGLSKQTQGLLFFGIALFLIISRNYWDRMLG